MDTTKKTPGGPKAGNFNSVVYHAERSGDADQHDHHKRKGVRPLDQQDNSYGAGPPEKDHTTYGAKYPMGTDPEDCTKLKSC